MGRISLKDLKPNLPKAILEDYIWTIYGRPKVGKTSLFLELCQKYFQGDVSKALLIAFEKGYQALNGVYAQDVNFWEDFTGTVDELIREREDLPFRFIGIDTVDEMYKICATFIVKREKIKDKKSYKTIGDIPYGQGYDMIDKEMSAQITRLQKAGYGIMFITHDTDKKFESRDGISYDKTTVSLPKRARDLIINMSDFIIFIDNAKKQDGDIVYDERIIHFRADGSDLEAGSRFKNIAANIPYDTDLFLKTFTEAVQGSYNGKVDVAKLQEQHRKEKEEQGREFAEQEANKMSADDIKKEIEEKISSATDEVKGAIKEQFKGALNGSFNFKKVEDIDILTGLLQIVNDLTESN